MLAVQLRRTAELLSHDSIALYPMACELIQPAAESQIRRFISQVQMLLVVKGNGGTSAS